MIVNIKTLLESELSITQFLLLYFICTNNKNGMVEYVEKHGAFSEKDYTLLIDKGYLFTSAPKNAECFSFATVFGTVKGHELIRDIEYVPFEDTLMYSIPSYEEVEPLILEHPKTIEQMFEEFWETYPKKRGQTGIAIRTDKQACEKLYKLLLHDKPSLHKTIMAGLSVLKAKEERNKEFQYMPKPLKFLEENMWNEYIEQIEEKLKGNDGIIETGSLYNIEE